MNIRLAKSSGFCFGVKRALDMTLDLANKSKKNVYTLGDIINNSQVVERLSKMGISSTNNIDDLKEDDYLIIRSHGVPTKIIDKIKEKDINFIDATCPFVSKIHKLVSSAKNGSNILIFGDKNHPEVIGIVGHCNENCKVFVFKNEDELRKFLSKGKEITEKPLTVVSQTTFDNEKWKKSIEIIKKVCTNASIFDTICNATLNRQQETIELAKSSDCMIVIGGKKSSNTRKLGEISKRYCQNTYIIETKEELEDSIDNLVESENVGITAGASTPADIIMEVINFMEDIKENQEELSFEELLEESLQNMSTDEKVHGVVVSFTPNEVYVDVGRKQAGIVPLDELTSDPNAKIEDLVKVGDEMDLLIMKTNDVEGTILLSKKRLDSLKGWDEMVKAYEDKTILTGTVVKVVKGGVIAVTNSIRIFIPLSQSGLKKTDDADSLLKKEVKFRIIELNKFKRRVVASIKSVLDEEKRNAMESFWNEVEIGKKYKGAVRSITSYGVFVDLGGIDGMVHISELSWGNVKRPSDLVKVGDEIEVEVKDFDKEKGRISLTCKNEDNNPWNIIERDYNVGDIIDCEIVSMTSYGAFAKVIPGIDGLIHISQISDKRINKPQDVLAVGEQVKAKIIDIDIENKRISLSIKEVPKDEESNDEEIED